MAQSVVDYKGQLTFTLNDVPGVQANFVLGIRKSGSSIFNNIVQALARFNDANFIDVAGRLFDAGLSAPQWRNDPGLCAILKGGNTYGGFRNCPTCFLSSQVFKDGRKVLLVRDPRDAIVSEYFSNAFSHSIPVAGNSREEMLGLRQQAAAMPLEEYVLKKAESMRQAVEEYRPLTRDTNCKLFRYEDVIFEKGQLMEEVCAFFDWRLSADQKAQILSWADVVPTEERPKEFVRRVAPGDHREKLSPGVIRQLNGIFQTELRHFGYDS